jgi:hypothetical protein
MRKIRYKAVIFVIALVTLCLGVIVFNLLLPVPMSISRQIEADISGRAYDIQPSRPISQGLLEQLLPYNPRTYSYEFLEVIHLDLEDGNSNLPLSDNATNAICIKVLIKYTKWGERVILNRPNPETNHYLAYKQDDDWSVRNLDGRLGAIGCQ